MPGYNPRCDNCFRCMTCKGEGWINEPKVSGDKQWYERKTCRTCNGAGGKAGAGKHDHG